MNATINKGEVFRQAHKLTKEVIKVGEQYRVVFGQCLRTVYARIKEGVNKVMIKSRKQEIKGLLESQGMSLGCYDPTIEKLPKAEAEKVIDALSYGDNTEVLVKSKGKYFVAVVESVDGEVDFQIISKENYIFMRGTYAWEDLLEWNGIVE